MRVASWILAAAAALVGGAAFAASPGETAFQQRCGTCHTMQAAPGKMGPPLAGVYGRKAGAVNGYKYSDALKGANVVWTRANLDAFLKSPQKIIPQSRMLIAVPNDEARAQILDYLAASKN